MDSNWVSSKLGDLCEAIFSGGTPQTSESSYWNGDLNWLSSGETRNRYIRETERTITQIGVDNSSTRKAKPGDIVVASAGQGLTRGQASYCLIDTYINQSVIAIRTKREIIDPPYLLFNLLNRYNELRSISDASSTRGSLTCRILENLPIEYPPLLTQRKIAAILSAYDDLIENNMRRIRILEEMAQNLYREWFVKFRFPGHQNARFVDSPLGRIPEGWETVNFSELYMTSSGGTPSRSIAEYYGGSHPWVKTRELNDGFILETEETITTLGLTKSSAKLFPENTVILAIYGATIGKLGILSMPSATNQACVAILPKEIGFGRAFAFLFLRENKDKLIGLGQGAAQQNISQVVLKKFPALRPAVSLMQEFSVMVEPLLDNVRNLQQKNTTLRRTRDLLLPKLISGEMDVSELDIAITEEAAYLNAKESPS